MEITTSQPYSVSTTTSVNPSQQFIKVLNGVFYITRSTDGTNMSIALALTVKNNAIQQINITKIEVPDLNFTIGLADVLLYPGDMWTQSFVVAYNIPYSPYWEAGTEHTVVIYFKVDGQAEEQSISISVGVHS